MRKSPIYRFPDIELQVKILPQTAIELKSDFEETGFCITMETALKR